MNRISIARRLAAIAAGLLLLALSGCDFGVFSGNDIENPKSAITGFIDAMQADKFDQTAADAAMSYVGNYSTMGFEKFNEVSDDPLEEILFSVLRSSYKAEFTDESQEAISAPYRSEDMTVSGKQAFVTFEFTSIDFSRLAEPLTARVSEIGAERVFEGETFETEEDAIALVEEIFLSEFDTENGLSEYCVTRELTLELFYGEDGWKIIVSDEFYDALLGR